MSNLDPLHESALALVAKMEALGYKFPDYTSGDYLRDVEAPLVRRVHSYGVHIAANPDEPCVCDTDFTCLATEHEEVAGGE